MSLESLSEKLARDAKRKAHEEAQPLDVACVREGCDGSLRGGYMTMHHQYLICSACGCKFTIERSR